MEPLEELIARRDAVKKELIELEKQIGRHPETIKQSFSHNPMWDLDTLESLVQQVDFIRVSPVWPGFIYQMDGKIYRVLQEMDGRYFCGLIHDEAPISTDLIDALWGADDPVTYLRENGITDEWQMIGHLLVLSMGGGNG